MLAFLFAPFRRHRRSSGKDGSSSGKLSKTTYTSEMSQYDPDDVEEEIQQSSRKVANKASRRVTFSGKVGMICVRHLNDCSQYDIESAWYTWDELMATRQEASRFVEEHPLAACTTDY